MYVTVIYSCNIQIDTMYYGELGLLQFEALLCHEFSQGGREQASASHLQLHCCKDIIRIIHMKDYINTFACTLILTEQVAVYQGVQRPTCPFGELLTSFW